MIHLLKAEPAAPRQKIEELQQTTQEKAMPYTRNHVSREPKSCKKKKTRTEQMQNIISLHITDDEKKALEKLTKSTSKSISDILREAIDMWSFKRRKLCME